MPTVFQFEAHPELPPHAPAMKAVENQIMKNCTPPSGWCPSPTWFLNQHGSGTITQNASGQYILPDGSVWTGTDAVYAGANNSGPLEGYIYYGSNGSQWFAGGNYASSPEPMSQYQSNMDKLTAQVNAQACGGNGN